MKKPLLLIFVFCAPLGDFFGFYADGWRIVPNGYGFLIAAASAFLLPFPMSLLLSKACGKSLFQKGVIFVGTLLVQFALVLGIVPPGASIKMLGISQRLNAKYSIPVVRKCSDEILQKYRQGTLSTNKPPPNVYPPISRDTVIVSDSELSKSLQGKFRCVAVVSNETSVQVVFEVEPQIGFLCSAQLLGEGFFHHKISNGIYVYHYQRP